MAIYIECPSCGAQLEPGEWNAPPNHWLDEIKACPACGTCHRNSDLPSTVTATPSGDAGPPPGVAPRR